MGEEGEEGKPMARKGKKETNIRIITKHQG